MNIRVYRCYNCHNPLTEERALEGEGCACGSRRVSPTNALLSELPKLLLEVLWIWWKKRNRKN